MQSLKLLVLASIFLFQGCIHLVSEPKNERIVRASKEMIWESLVLAFKPYPLEEVNEEKGLIKTEELFTNQLWKPIQKNKKSGMLYTLSAHLYPDDSGRFRIVILKNIQKQKDFFSKSQYITSDFIEEDEILYRVAREVKIKKLINKLKN